MPSRFQNFDDPAEPPARGARLAALRERLRALDLDGFAIPRADAHQNEYVPPSEERLAWLTGFTGSAGSAVVLADKAAVFVDGRYRAQARRQVDPELFQPHDSTETPPREWLRRNLRPGAKLGYDPWLHTHEGAERLKEACADAGATPAPVESNPIDDLWTDRPPSPLAPVVLHDERFAGESAAAKLDRIREELRKDKADALLVTDPHALAWTFNIRGSDVAHTPLPLGWAMIPAEGRPILLLDGRKLSDTVRARLGEIAELDRPEALDDILERLGAERATVRIDPAATAQRLAGRLEGAGATLQKKPDPIARLKAIKNAVEIAGARAAQLRDGAALVRFLAWLDREAAGANVTEIDAAEALEGFRHETGLLKDLSFPTISAAGPNAALPHYRVTRTSNRALEPGFFLIDSGAQYEDGTTDVTRTVAVGAPTAEMRDRFTRVLKGHIAIATAVFPKGATGAQLDPFARRPLWDAGADFDHGTGHGVGSYLSVHEGPQRISKLGHVALEPGMILSNEPAYYKEGAYGIRSENLVLVIDAEMDGAERPMLAFETLTLAPFDRRAIELELLTPAERTWLDAYHARMATEVGPLVDPETQLWLGAACAPLQAA